MTRPALLQHFFSFSPIPFWVRFWNSRGIKQAAVATTSPSQSKEGSYEAKFDGDNPPVDNEGKENDDAEELGDDDTNAEKSGDKDSCYTSMEIVHEFYANYYCTLEKKASSMKAIKKEPMIDSVRVRDIPVDISERTITRVLKGSDFTLSARTVEYDYCMEEMKGIKKLRTEGKVLHFQWMANIIAEDKKGPEWVIGRKLIYKASLTFWPSRGCASLDIASRRQ
ncbi:hypothetical protein HAX54_041997 [Datura stramonium]|uniref:Uncharacterized protein n=1 Tax=Datura stramonium TaxID=4076 RepID=A0ABS8SM00_DATST|nr:hypothetical protein [Datura stramonium]